MVAEVVEILKGQRFSLINEKELQAEIAKLLPAFNREHRLDARNITDFFLDGLALEVKITGTAKSIYKQCERYCKFSDVTSLLLVTNRSMGFPKEINGKPCYVFKLGNGWL